MAPSPFLPLSLPSFSSSLSPIPIPLILIEENEEESRHSRRFLYIYIYIYIYIYKKTWPLASARGPKYARCARGKGSAIRGTQRIPK